MTPWQSAFRKPRFRKRGHARTKRRLGAHDTWADPHREEWREVHERLKRSK